ncbi:hypothetical protein N665_0562s0014 [Sinapis alba]|nr:hypothetical protein N665_0562s0014 [Sinapis alba]
MRLDRLGSSPSEDGILPEKLDVERVKETKCLRLPMDSGMVPEKDDESILKTCRELILGKTGSLPLRFGFESNIMDCKFGIRKTLLGNSPTR